MYIYYVYFHNDTDSETGHFFFDDDKEAKTWFNNARKEVKSLCKNVATNEKYIIFDEHDKEIFIPALNDYMVAAQIWTEGALL